MAQTLTALAQNYDPVVVWSPSDHAVYNDLTTNGTLLTPKSPYKAVRLYINMKSFTSGTGTVGPIFYVQDNNGNALAIIQMPRLAQSCAFNIGQVPSVYATTQQVKSIASGTDTYVYDAMVDFIS